MAVNSLFNESVVVASQHGAAEAATVISREQTSWQEEMQQLVRSPAELLQLLELPAEGLNGAAQGAELFELRVPRPFIKKMVKGDLRDPLLLQVLPQMAETRDVPGYVADPLAEQSSNPHKGLIHKYDSRVLLTVAPACAINCRYCFRRHFAYGDNNPGRGEWLDVLAYIADDPSIKEVIFSGGDPLLSPDKQLRWLVGELEKIEHLQRLRIHTRLPVVIPQRVNDELLQWLADTRLQTVMVLHINHPNEIDSLLAERLLQLKALGVTLLNQSVLLKGVNDSVEVLAELSESLFAAGVLPYYLHLLDKTAGTAHFDCDKDSAVALHRALLARLSGFLVPKLVREVPGEASKVPIF